VIRGAKSGTGATDVVVPTRVGSAWQRATVTAIRDETPTTKTFRLALERPTQRKAGQHFLIRLTAPDGYTATRSYSIANEPTVEDAVEITVELLAGGEVSTFLHEVVEVGDELDVRGPIGEWFVWDGEQRALLVGGGSGVVPLMAMLRHARHLGRSDLIHLVLSVRSPGDLYYADEILGREVTIIYTRVAPAGEERAVGRLTADDLPTSYLSDATSYVCGSPAFADAATDLLMRTGVPTDAIRIERFGPSG
jgi:ferredoxin-NADP reductase